MLRSTLGLAFIVALLASGGMAGCTAEPEPRPSHPRRPDPAASILASRLPTVDYLGGRFLRHPTLHTITFTGDDPAVVGRLERFGDVVTASSWWHEVTAGYCAAADDCIGPGTPGRHVRLADRLPATVTDIDVEQLLTRAAAGGQFGAIDANTLLVVYPPPAVVLSDARVPRYCDGPRALHQSTNLNGRRVPYAVVPRCGDLDQVTVSASHEILEATTNPEPARRGFALSPRSTNLGFTAAGIEPADPCGLLLRPQPSMNRDGFALHRAWSNEAASRGADPCVPAPADQPYLAIVPEQHTLRLTDLGASTTVTVEAAADRPVHAWSITAVELADDERSPRHLDIAVDRDTIAPGQRATLTLTLRRANPDKPLVVLLVSTLDQRSHRWPLAVATT
jgi:hypothetical protein